MRTTNTPVACAHAPTCTRTLAPQEAETLLDGQAPGTFLIRIAQTRLGYSLSSVFSGRTGCVHMMIDLTDDSKYILLGESFFFK